MFPTAEHIQAAQYAANYWKDKVGVYVWPSVTLAQAFIESAGWTKLAGKNNGFGIKATQAQIDSGHASYAWTKEQRNGVMVSEQHYFADFDTLADAYIAHGRILATLKYYRDAQQAKDVNGFIDGLGAYATATNYRASIRAVMDRMKLEQYDQPGDMAAPKPAKPPLHPAVIPGAAAGAGGVIVATIPHLAVPNIGMIAAFVIVAAVVGGFVFMAHRKQSAANLAAVSVKPDPTVVKLLDETAPLPSAT